MTWNRGVSGANWLQLGYVAANVASIVSPLSTGHKFVFSEEDQDLLRQQARFFSDAIAGLSSFDQPSLLFHTSENSISYPAGALNTIADTYSSVHGGPLADPKRFKNDLQSYKTLLSGLKSNQPLDTGQRATAKELLRLLAGLISRAQIESHRSATQPK
jgi:hypothetical protein